MLKASASRSAAQPQATTAAADQGSHTTTNVGTDTIEDGSGLTSPHVDQRSNSSTTTGIKGKIRSRYHSYFSVATRRKIFQVGLAFLGLWVVKKIVEILCRRFFIPLEYLYPPPVEGKQPFFSFLEFNHKDEKLLMDT